MHRGSIEPTRYPRNPLDVLAQQLVAMIAVEPWHADDFDTACGLEEKQQLRDGGKLREVARAVAVPREQVLTAVIGDLREQLAI